MKFEFVSRRDFNFIAELAKKMGCRPEGDTLKLPKHLGEGTISKLTLGADLMLISHRHRLKEELIILRHSSPVKNGLVTITFNIAERPRVFLQDAMRGAPINLAAIYITSTDIGLETHFPANKNIHSTIILIHSSLILKFLTTHANNDLIESITAGNHSFWYDIGMTPEIQQILMQLEDPREARLLDPLFYRIKIQQLIYHLFVELLEKENRPFRSLKDTDIEKIYLLQETILSNLGAPPKLSKLARKVGFSETKMKLLFRQVFGKSIYNYFQVARMNEAAILLKKYSVTQTGHKLGFTNLSYFAKLFERHLGSTPQQFKKGLTA